MIDTHAHLYLLDQPLTDLVQQAKKTSLRHIINIGIDIDSSLAALAQSKQYPSLISATLGIHPCDCQGFTDYNQLRDLAQQEPFVAIGEIGLDYHHMTAPKQIQWDCFTNQLALAQELDLPVVIHNRKADADVAAIIQDFPKVKKVLHCFSSSITFAESILNDSTFFSFTATITFAKKGKTLTALKQLPLDHIMIETDCPYLKPAGVDALQNSPIFIGHILRKVANVRQLDCTELERQLDLTSLSFFNLIA